MSLTNFITYCCIEYAPPRAEFSYRREQSNDYNIIIQVILEKTFEISTNQNALFDLGIHI
jgi:hypothetical protein